LLLVPVMVAGFLRYKDLACDRLILRLSVLFGIVVTFLVSTPAVILRPVEVLNGIHYEVSTTPLGMPVIQCRLAQNTDGGCSSI
jgi:hypothetical protein